MPASKRHMHVGAKLLAATAMAGALFCSLASAEVSQKDGVRVSVTGRMTPTRLPRTGAAPIAVSVAGHISAAQTATLPKLSKITIAINRHGRQDLRGLPLCRLGRINPSTDAEALAACRSSLIGEGSFSADVKIPTQSPFPSQGKVLAFNGRLRGKPAIFAHIYGIEPVPTSYVLSFSIAKTPGIYGTVLEASLPHITGEWGYVTGISLRLNRVYTSGGKSHSYLSAGCPAPRGFSSAVFPLAKTTFGFDDGLKLSSILNRSCKVR